MIMALPTSGSDAGSKFMNSRKANALGMRGAVACDQTTAARVGIRVLDDGGNAADAAVAVAAVLNILQPSTYGIGGDAWILYYDKSLKSISCLDGSGKSATDFTTQKMQEMGFQEQRPPAAHPVCVTVPGATAAWCDLHEKFGSGRQSLANLFRPAIELAETGFPVSATSAHLWRSGYANIHIDQKYPFPKEFLNPESGRPPKEGDIMRLPHLARSYRELAENGKGVFYQGRIANAIVDCVQSNGGLLHKEDLASHQASFKEPLSVSYTSQNLQRTVKIWETSMNTQAVVTLEALKILETYGKDLKKMSLDEYYHTILESLKLSFNDLSDLWKAAESGTSPSASTLLSPENVTRAAKMIRPDKALKLDLSASSTRLDKGDTTYFCIVDEAGNAVSAVCSNYDSFGTPWVPEGCGFTLHNRGCHFWEYMHRKFAPATRPFHTLCAGMVTDEEEDFLGAFGCMGGHNQPQGHLQVVLNMLEMGLSPQEALDRQRLMTEFDFETKTSGVFVEDGDMAEKLVKKLEARGHNVQGIVKNFDRNKFGRGHAISRDSWWDPVGRVGAGQDVLWAGSDPRSDGSPLTQWPTP